MLLFLRLCIYKAGHLLWAHFQRVLVIITLILSSFFFSLISFLLSSLSFYSLDSEDHRFQMCPESCMLASFTFLLLSSNWSTCDILKWERWFTDFGIRTERSSTLHLSWHNEPKGLKHQDGLIVAGLKPHGNQLLRKHLNLKRCLGLFCWFVFH